MNGSLGGDGSLCCPVLTADHRPFWCGSGATWRSGGEQAGLHLSRYRLRVVQLARGFRALDGPLQSMLGACEAAVR